MRKFLLILTIFILSISINPVKALEKAADTLKKNVVTTGDGLYVDSTIDGRYIYKGSNPNNFIKLDDDLYRIISLEKDGTIKVIKQDSIKELPLDFDKARFSSDVDSYCDSNWGGGRCNAWGSKSTTLDANGNKVTQMSRKVDGKLYNLPDEVATLNTYLNIDFYNSLSNELREKIITKDWNIGSLNENQTDLLESMKEESRYKWRGKIALISSIDFVKATTKNECSSLKDFKNYSTCYNNNNEHNYLAFKNDNFPSDYWTLSSESSDYCDVAYRIFDSLRTDHSVSASHDINPSFYLASTISLNGDGTKETPYTLVTTDADNDKKENIQNNNLPKIVDVILKKVVNAGDGLYADKYNDGRYVYKGANPNNFIEFNNELWRIISIEKDGKIKIIKDKPLNKMKFNTKNSNGTYCRILSEKLDRGCSAWAKTGYYYGGSVGGGTSVTVYEGTVNEDSTLNTYLNNDFYNSLSAENRCAISEGKYYFGSVNLYHDNNIDSVLPAEKANVWKGNVALPVVSDILNASSDMNNCASVTQINNGYYVNENGEAVTSECFSNDDYEGVCYIKSCQSNNYLLTEHDSNIGYTLLNTASSSGEIVVELGGRYSSKNADSKNSIRPVLYLTSGLEYLSGEGTADDPYEIIYDKCGIKGKNNIKNNLSNLIVNVPSTSMFISIFIIGGFILSAAICIGIYLKVFKKKDVNK